MPLKQKAPFTVLVEANNSRGTVLVENVSKRGASGSNAEAVSRLSGDLDADQKLGLELNNLVSDWEDGDEVAVKVVGIRSGFGTFTIDSKKGSKKLKILQTSNDYAGASVSL